MPRVLSLLLAAPLLACGPDSKPAGTTADPVEVCEESAQVCRLAPGVLGVCTRQGDATLVCASQH